MILVTGGAGYIGSHFVDLLIKENKEVVVFDNLSRGHKEAVPKNTPFEEVDILNYADLSSRMKKYKIDAIVHFAAFAYVGESVEDPGLYYTNNVAGSLNLIKAAVENNVTKIVFSSTCSIYGNNASVPISETDIPDPINPYASSKLMIERILSDFSNVNNFNFVALRYFNAAGDNPNGLIGESHNPEPHIIPIIIETALGKREKVFIFGNDYNTDDGTCIRDYIHVADLADAHLRALNFLDQNKTNEVINLGTGEGTSVLELIKLTEKITSENILYEITPRREGDPAKLVADNKKAKDLLGWEPKKNIEEIIKTAWSWHKAPKY
ncbi:MAG: UDP-glucose 4-epimerase GalE [Melioribacteraceae bacterium]|nr:UDP-glucose 4-epimerase GalE [Melioribacteraceae bacterium]